MRRSLILLVSSALVLAAHAAASSCAGPAPGTTKAKLFEMEFQAATSVFIGTVVGFRQNDQRFAVVRVDEVRKGPALPKEVEVHGTPMQPNDPNSPIQGASSIDRTYLPDGRYLFMFDTVKPPFQDSSCGPTRDLAGGFPGKRLIDIGEDIPQPVQRTGIPWAAAGGGAAAILAALIGLAVADRRARRSSNDQSGV